MRVKTLFREFGTSTISGVQGSADITGSGTTFTDIPLGTILEASDIGFIGKIASITDDTHLTLDRVVGVNFSGKELWQDWTPWLISFGNFPENCESDKPGEAGLIICDSVGFEFYYFEQVNLEGTVITNPVWKAFSGDLDSKDRYLIKFFGLKKDYYTSNLILVTDNYDRLIDNLGNYISVNYKADQSYEKFEGMVDFNTLEYPEVRYKSGNEMIPSVTFDVFDKFSGMALITAYEKQRNEDTLFERIYGLPYLDKIWGWTIVNDTTPAYEREFGLFFSNSAYTAHSNISTLLYEVGDIIIHPDDIGLDPSEQRVGIVTQSYLETESTLMFTLAVGTDVYFTDVTYNRIKVFSHDDDINWEMFSNVGGSAWAPKDFDYHNYHYYSKNYYGGDIGLIENVGGIDTLTNFDLLKITELFAKNIWLDTTVESRIYDSGGDLIEEYEFSLHYFERLIGANPFDKDPIDFLIYLANTVFCYIKYFGNTLMLQNRLGFSFIDSGNDIALPSVNCRRRRKKHIFDKIVDAVEINIETWIWDTSEYLTGNGSKKKTNLLKPRNKLTKNVILDKVSLAEYGISINKDGTLADATLPGATQDEILTKYAELKAEDYFDFYGKRHEAYYIEYVNISWEMFQWQLFNTYSYNSKRFFATSLEVNSVLNELKIEIVEISGSDYNANTIVLGRQQEDYNSAL